MTDEQLQQMAEKRASEYCGGYNPDCPDCHNIVGAYLAGARAMAAEKDVRIASLKEFISYHLTKNAELARQNADLIASIGCAARYVEYTQPSAYEILSRALAHAENAAANPRRGAEKENQ